MKNLIIFSGVDDMPVLERESPVISKKLEKIKQQEGQKADEMVTDLHASGSTSQVYTLRKIVEAKRKRKMSEDEDDHDNKNKKTLMSVVMKSALNTKIVEETTVLVKTNKADNHGTPVKLYKVETPEALKKNSPSVSMETKGRSLVNTLTTCYICRQEFHSYEMLKLHMKGHEDSKTDKKGSKGEDDMIACGLCGLECRKADMEEHFKTHGIEEDSASSEMPIPSMMESMLEGKDEDVNTDTEEESKQCQKITPNSKEFKCGICGYMLPTDDLAAHMENHNHEADSMQFDDLFTFGTEVAVDDEGNTVMESEFRPMTKKVFRCKKCDYPTNRSSRIREHVRTCCIGVAQYGCRYCGGVYKIKRNLVVHMKTHESEDASGPVKIVSPGHTCKKCGYTTTNQSHYDDHIITCENKGHECEICGKSFRIRKYLNKHRRIHKVGDCYVCKTCNFKTDSGVQLGKHVLACKEANGEKCKFCDKSFQSADELVRHLSSRECKNAESEDNGEATGTTENVQTFGRVVGDIVEDILFQEDENSSNTKSS